MEHFSKFLPPSSVVDETENSDSILDPHVGLSVVSAIPKAGQTVMVIVNPGASDRSFVVRDVASQRQATSKILAHSIQTLVY